MKIFTQITLVVGRVTPQGVNMLGTGFLIQKNGIVATTRHVAGDDPKGLVVLFPHIDNIESYQDLSDTSCKPIPANIIESDPTRDIAILATDLKFDGVIPEIGSFDKVNIGEKVGIFGYPHATEGRRALTFQETEIGAKVLLESESIKSKCAVINTQARPGQSGSLIYSPRIQNIVGMLVGAYSPSAGSGIRLGNIDPYE
ncbi:MAG TPA: serine protease, partial [Bacteroidetes bacterium]|nr:serine protease [Bacteroidota bacterium]